MTLRTGLFLLVLQSVLFCQGGCTNVDGFLRYTYEGTLKHSPSGAAIAGATVVPRFVELSSDQQEEVLLGDVASGRASITDPGGHYSGSLVGDMWGYSMVLGFIPWGSTQPPVPTLYDHITLYIRVDGKWHKEKVSLAVQAQPPGKPGVRHMIIPEVSLRTP
jgi:hypothetical protein